MAFLCRRCGRMGKKRTMGVTKVTTAPSPETVSTFLAAVTAALPAAGFWSMPVLAAVSGGPDSVSMLLALRSLVPADAVGRLIVVHAEHDLRADAFADRKFVERLAVRLGLPVVSRRLAVAPLGGEGIEAAARRLRHAFFVDAAAEVGGRHVLVAHTADDQAETILHRLLRGTGVAGLAGMSPARELASGISLLRPLLAVRRSEVLKFLAAMGEDWLEDPTNLDRRHARNLVRHDVLAICERTRYPSCTEAIVRLGRQAAATAGALRSAAERLLDEHVSHQPDARVVVRSAGLRGLDSHLVAEVFVALWQREGWPQRDMTARHYARLAALVGHDANHPAAIDLPGGVHVAPEADALVCIRRGCSSPSRRSGSHLHAPVSADGAEVQQESQVDCRHRRRDE